MCQKKWWQPNIYRKSIRFFMIDGVQYDEDDFNFIKNKDRIYVSRGEEFDERMNFGEYKIIKQIGEGAFGKVLLAQNIITQEFSAVKVLKVEKICKVFPN